MTDKLDTVLIKPWSKKEREAFARKIAQMNRTDKLNKFLLILGCFLLLMLAGIGYALYLSVYCSIDHSTWRAHLLQWWPFVSAIAALVFGLRRIETDTKFAEFGLIGVFTVAMPVGYVMGRLLFF